MKTDSIICKLRTFTLDPLTLRRSTNGKNVTIYSSSYSQHWLAAGSHPKAIKLFYFNIWSLISFPAASHSRGGKTFVTTSLNFPCITPHTMHEFRHHTGANWIELPWFKKKNKLFSSANELDIWKFAFTKRPSYLRLAKIEMQLQNMAKSITQFYVRRKFQEICFNEILAWLEYYNHRKLYLVFCLLHFLLWIEYTNVLKKWLIFNTRINVRYQSYVRAEQM